MNHVRRFNCAIVGGGGGGGGGEGSPCQSSRQFSFHNFGTVSKLRAEIKTSETFVFFSSKLRGAVMLFKI